MEFKMKKFLILFVVLLSATFFAQTPNWTGVKETNINVGSASSVDIFTNRDGNHIIVQESNNLKYYKMNLNGVAGSPITIESSAVFSPSISGNGDYIFIVYGIGSQVRVRRSTNGGTSWSLWTSFSIATSASWMESEVSNEKLHVTYLESGIVKYRYRIQDGSTWSSIMVVSEGETGTLPRITTSYGGTNKDSVYFMWQKAGTYQINHRRYELTSNSWSSILFGHTVSDPNVNIYSANLAGFRVTGTTIVVYFAYEGIDQWSNYQYYFNWVWRNKSDNTYEGIAYPNLNQTKKVYSTTTFDGNSHTAFYYQQIAGGEGGEQEVFAIWRSKQSNGYFDDVIYDYYYNPPQNQPMHVNVSSAGNEVHAIWKDDYGNNNGNNLRYKWDNQNPIAPQNLSITSHNGHPKLVWTKNPDADTDFYRIYKKITGQQDFEPYATSSTNYYIDNEEDLCTVPPPAQCQNEFLAKYKITAEDLTDKESDFSNEVEARLIGGDPEKQMAHTSKQEIYSYELEQNYPNPFNPVTSINYQIKEKGFVTLKIYDMLGREVADLLSEDHEPGQYSVVFNASNLPSGVYVYSLRVNDFVQNNKMTLLK
jgi:hypothetical protein